MDAKVIEYQMKSLPSYVGQQVSCIYWELGVQKSATGELQLVQPYDRVIVGNVMIQFVGANDAIEQITADNGTTIYVWVLKIIKGVMLMITLLLLVRKCKY